MTPPGRDRRPAHERGPVDWGTQRAPARPAAGGPAGAPQDDPVVLDADDADDAPAGRPTGRTRPGPDWGVGRGAAPAQPTPGQRARSPWPEAVRTQRLAGIAFALTGLVLATWSAMNLATNAESGRLWVPPWLVVVLAGAGLVSAAGYLAWAGGTAVRGEAERWQPTVLDAAAGLTVGTVNVADPHRLLEGAFTDRPSLGAGPHAGPPGSGRAPTGGGPPPAASVESGPTPLMGTSTFDQSTHAPAGVAGAVGGFLLAAAIVCAVIALVLGPAWLIATVALALGGIVSIRLAADWLGHV
ncbi:MAG: PsbA protein [Actinomyces sp.]|uniref:PsbA protein n=1 Tax=Actinomyces sp. TaxID=29317 RepID=UPI0026DBFCEC|nr:PsbA protein [Actinomyces sp.]MDO4244107.1 PsbA protein [Actinomyces sp.]